MRKIVFQLAVSDDINAKELELRAGEFALLVYLQNRDLRGKSPATYDELLEEIPVTKRTLDGALATLKKRNLIKRVISFCVTEEGRQTGT